MKIEVKKFGTILVSRPAGHEAFLAARAYLLHPKKDETIELDFAGVDVLAPSWADEFITGIRKNCANPLKILPTQNPSVIESLRTLNIPI